MHQIPIKPFIEPGYYEFPDEILHKNTNEFVSVYEPAEEYFLDKQYVYLNQDTSGIELENFFIKKGYTLCMKFNDLGFIFKSNNIYITISKVTKYVDDLRLINKTNKESKQFIRDKTNRSNLNKFKSLSIKLSFIESDRVKVIKLFTDIVTNLTDSFYECIYDSSDMYLDENIASIDILNFRNKQWDTRKYVNDTWGTDRHIENLDLNYKPVKIDGKKRLMSDIHKYYVNLISDSKSGALLFSGPPGTGKTQYCYYLIADLCKSDHKILKMKTSDLNHIQNPEFESFLAEYCNEYKVIILIEDAEAVIHKNSDPNQVAIMRNLLDGADAEMLGLKFILTYNCPTNEIDEAILRPGRTLFQHDFLPLPEDQAEKLCKEINADFELLKKKAGKTNGSLLEKWEDVNVGFNKSNDKHYTLAEIYDTVKTKRFDSIVKNK